MATSRETFAVGVLQGLGLPVTPSNIDVLLGAMAGENTTAAFNPLATTQGAQGATNFNKVGVKNYNSFEQGVQATVQTLSNGYYNAILDAMKQSDAEAAIHAWAASPWGTGNAAIAGYNNITGNRVAYTNIPVGEHASAGEDATPAPQAASKPSTTDNLRAAAKALSNALLPHIPGLDAEGLEQRLYDIGSQMRPQDQTPIEGQHTANLTAISNALGGWQPTQDAQPTPDEQQKTQEVKGA